MNANLQPGQLFQTADGRIFTLATPALATTTQQDQDTQIEVARDGFDKEGDGANKPGDRCGEFEGVSSGCDHAGDEDRGRRRFSCEEPVVLFGDRLFHHLDEPVGEVEEARFEPVEELFPEL